jgi:hypothetical protein
VKAPRQSQQPHPRGQGHRAKHHGDASPFTHPHAHIQPMDVNFDFLLFRTTATTEDELSLVFLNLE